MKCYSSDNTNVCGGLEGPQILLLKQGTIFWLGNRGPRLKPFPAVTVHLIDCAVSQDTVPHRPPRRIM
jgi:hypothetical protein